MSQSEMEAMHACEQCGSLLPARRKLKTFCSYACRGQHNALKAISGLSSPAVPTGSISAPALWRCCNGSRRTAQRLSTWSRRIGSPLTSLCSWPDMTC